MVFLICIILKRLFFFFFLCVLLMERVYPESVPNPGREMPSEELQERVKGLEEQINDLKKQLADVKGERDCLRRELDGRKSQCAEKGCGYYSALNVIANKAMSGCDDVEALLNGGNVDWSLKCASVAQVYLWLCRWQVLWNRRRYCVVNAVVPLYKHH